MKKIIVDKVTYWYNTKVHKLFADVKGKVSVNVKALTENQVNQIVEQLNY